MAPLYLRRRKTQSMHALGSICLLAMCGITRGARPAHSESSDLESDVRRAQVKSTVYSGDDLSCSLVADLNSPWNMRLFSDVSWVNEFKCPDDEWILSAEAIHLKGKDGVAYICCKFAESSLLEHASASLVQETPFDITIGGDPDHKSCTMRYEQNSILDNFNLNPFSDRASKNGFRCPAGFATLMDARPHFDKGRFGVLFFCCSATRQSSKVKFHMWQADKCKLAYDKNDWLSNKKKAFWSDASWQNDFGCTDPANFPFLMSVDYSLKGKIESDGEHENVGGISFICCSMPPDSPLRGKPSSLLSTSAGGLMSWDADPLMVDTSSSSMGKKHCTVLFDVDGGLDWRIGDAGWANVFGCPEEYPYLMSAKEHSEKTALATGGGVLYLCCKAPAPRNMYSEYWNWPTQGMGHDQCEMLTDGTNWVMDVNKVEVVSDETFSNKFKCPSEDRPVLMQAEAHSHDAVPESKRKDDGVTYFCCKQPEQRVEGSSWNIRGDPGEDVCRIAFDGNAGSDEMFVMPWSDQSSDNSFGCRDDMPVLMQAHIHKFNAKTGVMLFCCKDEATAEVAVALVQRGEEAAHAEDSLAAENAEPKPDKVGEEEQPALMQKEATYAKGGELEGRLIHSGLLPGRFRNIRSWNVKGRCRMIYDKNNWLQEDDNSITNFLSSEYENDFECPEEFRLLADAHEYTDPRGDVGVIYFCCQE